MSYESVEDDGGSVEKSMLSQEVYMEHVTNRNLNNPSFQKTPRRPSEEKT